MADSVGASAPAARHREPVDRPSAARGPRGPVRAPVDSQPVRVRRAVAYGDRGSAARPSLSFGARRDRSRSARARRLLARLLSRRSRSPSEIVRRMRWCSPPVGICRISRSRPLIRIGGGPARRRAGVNGRPLLMVHGRRDRTIRPRWRSGCSRRRLSRRRSGGGRRGTIYPTRRCGRRRSGSRRRCGPQASPR